MAQAKTRDSTPPLDASALSEVAHGLFELEEPLLRIRSLVLAARMLADSSEMEDEAGLALDALADTILDEVERVKDERTRLWHVARQSAGDANAES